MVNLETLAQRREKLSLKFAQKCLKNPKVKDVFPLTDSKHIMRKRNPKKFKEFRINTRRYQKSALPYMKKLLNKNEESKRKILNQDY